MLLRLVNQQSHITPFNDFLRIFKKPNENCRKLALLYEALPRSTTTMIIYLTPIWWRSCMTVSLSWGGKASI